MNILIVTPYYPPVTSSLSDMMSELAEGLVEKGHRVTVATAWLPHKMGDAAKSCEFKELTTENGVRIIRIRSDHLNSSFYILRGIYQLLMPFIYRRKIGKYTNGNFDTVIVYTPPLSYASIGSSIKKKCNARYLLNVQDIFPQNAIDLGIMKNRALIRLFEHLENKAYQDADVISSHTRSSRKFLISVKKIHEHKIHYIPNWIDTTLYTNACRTNRFRKSYGFENKYVFIFAGVIGPSQGLDYMVRVAGLVQTMTDDIRFLIVGDGAEKKNIIKMAERYGVGNLLFKPLIPLKDYPELLKDADVGIVCLNKNNRTPVVPAKLWGYMAASMPVLAFLNKESDGHEIIKEAKCGYTRVSDNCEEGAKLVKRMYDERQELKRYGRNGYDYVERTFAKQECINKIEQLIY